LLTVFPTLYPSGRPAAIEMANRPTVALPPDNPGGGSFSGGNRGGSNGGNGGTPASFQTPRVGRTPKFST